MKRATHLIVLVAFIFSCGGQWAVLQGIAWVKMIHDYAQFVPISDAVGMTLSGQYPCKICQAIAEKKASERAQFFALEKIVKKILPSSSVATFQPFSELVRYPDFSIFLRMRSDVPPTPPPRSALS